MVHKIWWVPRLKYLFWFHILYVNFFLVPSGFCVNILCLKYLISFAGSSYILCLFQLGRNSYIRDPTTIQLLFEISQALHDDLDFVNVKDDDNQPAHLISRFVHMVNNFMLILPISSSKVRLFCGYQYNWLDISCCTSLLGWLWHRDGTPFNIFSRMSWSFW